jgi:hypothetical protein
MPLDHPKVFISYSHDSPEHAKRVLELAERLRADGVDAQIDQYVDGTPAEGWPRWMLNRLDWTEFVLVVCTETYYRRFRGHEEPGKGADWEGNLITVEIYDAKSKTTKFASVFFASKDEQFIPEPLRGRTQYPLNSEENYTKLYAFLTRQAGVTPGKLGLLKTLARNPVKPLRFADSEVAQDFTAEIFDIFLCHNREDKPAIREIWQKLAEKGVKPWLDEKETKPKTSWQMSLGQQIESIKSAAVFVGESGIGPWEDKEVQVLLSQFVKRKCPVIPAILPSAKTTPDLPWTMMRLVCCSSWGNPARARPRPCSSWLRISSPEPRMTPRNAFRSF